MDEEAVDQLALSYRTRVRTHDYPPDYLVHGVEYQRVPPHGDGDCVIPIRKTVRRNEQALRVGEDPYAENHQEVHKIAEIGLESS